VRNRIWQPICGESKSASTVPVAHHGENSYTSVRKMLTKTGILYAVSIEGIRFLGRSCLIRRMPYHGLMFILLETRKIPNTCLSRLPWLRCMGHHEVAVMFILTILIKNSRQDRNMGSSPERVTQACRQPRLSDPGARWVD
jgi:hypothetical protein